MVRGSPCMCTATQPAPVSAATSQREAEMSLTSVAPAATAARATAAFVVSTETRAPAAASASTTGTTRASSSSSGTGSAPGREDSPADVDDVGSLGHQLEPVGHGALGGGVEAAVGEGVGGHVEHPHDERPPRSRRHRVSGPG